MRTKVISGLLWLIFSMKFAVAQKPNVTKEEIESMRVAFITKFVDLNPQEAQLFWPVFNEYQQKQVELRKSHKEVTGVQPEQLQKLSDTEIQKLLDNHFLLKQKETELQKEYHARFLAVLSPKKVALLYLSQEEFKKYLLQKIRQQGPTK